MAPNLKKAKQRLDQARSALSALPRCKTFVEFEKEWLNFLLHAGGVYTQLEQATKPDVSSRQWYGAKKRQRKSDPLLSYMHHARNADEHTLEQVSDFKPGRISIGQPGSLPPGKSARVVMNIEKPVDFEYSFPGAESPLIEMNSLKLRAKPVTDRGIQYEIPKSHLAKEISNPTPEKLAELTVQFVSDLIVEAESKFP